MAEKKICPKQKCSKENSEKRFFCGKCGTFLDGENIKNRELISLPESKLKRILENLPCVPHNKIIWDSTVDNYVKKIEAYRALYEIEDIKDNYNQSVADKMQDFLDLCEKAEFQIAFVGTIKTGKSTLINALLGRNYASMAVTPETAALTKFRSSPKNYVKISFYTKQEWKKLWASVSKNADKFQEEYKELKAHEVEAEWVGHETILNYVSNDEIEENLSVWSTSKRPEHYFVREIEVGIADLPINLPAQVVFVDTPGLSDPVAYRSEITRNYIRKANAVFVCVDAGKIHKEEMETLDSVFSFSSHNRSKVHIIATHWDVAFNDLEKGWREQKEYLYKQLVSPHYYEDRKMAESNIDYAAAYIYNLCRDYISMEEEAQKAAKKPLRAFLDKYEEDPEMRTMRIIESLSFMMEKANVDHIKNTITNSIVANYRKMLNEDIKKKYSDITFALRRAVRESRKLKKETLDTSRSTKAKRQEKVEEQKKACEALKRYQDTLQSYIKVVDGKTADNLQQIIKAFDQPPREAYKSEGTKLYDTVMKKIKKFKLLG